jgi:hypothetical protein
MERITFAKPCKGVSRTNRLRPFRASGVRCRLCHMVIEPVEICANDLRAFSPPVQMQCIAFRFKTVIFCLFHIPNSKIQPVKGMARGYRNVRNFINMIYFLTAKLKFDYPLYSL